MTKNKKMDKLKELLSRCKASVSIVVNQHRDFYESVESYIETHSQFNVDEIDLDVYEEMKRTDTVIEIYAYPDTPIGSYQVTHYDIDKAINIMLDCVGSTVS